MAVDPARLPRWLDGFRERHGPVSVRADAGRLVCTGADGSVAQLYPPPGLDPPGDLAMLVAGAQAARRVGLLLARQGAAAVGVAEGERLLVSKVDSWYVQGRTAAGGQSQQRFARRRGNQAAHAAGKAAEIAVRLLLPAAAPAGGAGAGGVPATGLAAVVTGGDRRTVAAILADPRLAPVAALRAERHLPVATPNLAVLREAVRSARAVAIHLPA